MSQKAPKIGDTFLGIATFNNRDCNPVYATIETINEIDIRLTLLVNGNESPQASKWYGIEKFLLGTNTGKKEESPQEPPNHITVKHTQGEISFLGCVVVNSQGSINDNLSTVRLRAPYVVFGPINNENPGGVRSIRAQIAGLYQWIRPSIATSCYERNEHTKFSINFSLPEKIDIFEDDDFNHSIQFMLTENRSDITEAKVKNNVFIQTAGNKNNNSWVDILNFANIMADIITLCADSYSGITAFESKHHKDSRLWNFVVSDKLHPELSHKDYKYDFSYSDITDGGIRKWIELREKHPRILNPFLSNYEVEGVYAESKLSSMGIAIEALGFHLLSKDGADPETKENRSIYNRSKRIIQELGEPYKSLDDWFPREMNETYNGLKHANKEMPTAVELATMADAAGALIRAWFLNQLGLDVKAVHDAVKHKLSLDRFGLVPDPSELE